MIAHHRSGYSGMKEAKEAEADVALELLKLQRTFQDGMRRSDVKAIVHVACGER